MLALLLSLATSLPPLQEPQSQPAPVPAPKEQEPPAQEPAGQKPATQEPDNAPIKVKARRKGLSTSIVQSLAKAIDWIAAHQEKDGRWRSLEPEGEADAKGQGNGALDVGVTGLALLALLSEGHNSANGKYKDRVTKGVAWLLKQQDEKSGQIGGTRSSYSAYNHAIATWALAEALRLGKDAGHKAQVEKALDHTERRRNPYKVWRYSPRDGDNDSSVTGWMMLGLLSAERQGIPMTERTRQMALSWYDEVTDPATGQVGYTRRGEGSARNINQKIGFPAENSEALTALSLLVRMRCGQRPDKKPTMKLARERILAIPPQWTPENGNIDLYYWFFASMALSEEGHQESRKWTSLLMPALTKSQVTEGKNQGSWDPIGAWGNVGGRCYMSALATLSLSAATGKSRLLVR